MAAVTLYAMDGCALLAFLRGEPGDTMIAGLLADQNNVCRIHAINLCEVYYDTLRVATKLNPVTSQAQAQGDVAKVIATGVELREDMDEAFWQMVGQFKVSPGKFHWQIASCWPWQFGSGQHWSRQTMSSIELCHWACARSCLYDRFAKAKVW